MFEDSRRVDPDQEFPALAAAIEEIPLRVDRSGAGAAVTVQARALIALRRRLDARLLDLLAVIDEQGLADGDGFSSTAGWVRGYANVDAHHASAWVAAARVADRLPELGAVLAAGAIGGEALAAVAAGARGVPAEVLAEHDQTLRNLAPHVRPQAMRQAGQAIQVVCDETASAGDARHVGDGGRVSLGRTF